MKKRTKHRKKRSRKRLADVVANLAASGLVEDQIALRLNIDKNQLRSKYIDDIKRGKAVAAARAAEACDLTREIKFACDAILSAFDGWDEPDGNLLWHGVNGDGAARPADAFARWVLDGGKFICTGLDDGFSRERLLEFAELKAAAQELLKSPDDREQRHTAPPPTR